ncbi:hypothetical protein G9C85_02715 [Halorubellus sp. JP-L1]|uniref:hypothetical protein n=1 Tax=Halorubellus sp. JP-L1 TaxID=2715753 RepID=UPI001407979C|nr:hypothetical protein [Halorubellus sp. JP-L1]NHN40550.1 hypothetical protein [Halorubellus sp. JP-L1]
MTPADVLIWLLAHPDLTATVATALAGSAGAARHYRKTGRVPLSSLPWRALRRLGYHLRRRFFSTPKPPIDALGAIQGNLEDVRVALGQQSYEPGWLLSYHYKGEDLNARRYFYDPSLEYPHRQLHIRGWDRGDHVAIDAHEEPAPLQHPRAHLREVDMQDATAWVTDAYDAGNGLDPRGFQ